MIEVNEDIFMEDAYHGIGGFKDGTYLTIHPRETVEKYDRRREISYYLNYTGTVIDSHVDPMFREEPSRQWEPAPLFDVFMKDVDTNGSSMTTFIKQAALQAAIHGVSFVVMDNTSDQPATLGAAILNRKLPYAYIVDRDQVKGYTINQAGRIISITYIVNTSKSYGDMGNDKFEEWTWTETTWAVKKSNGTIISSAHSLGRVPVLPLFIKKKTPRNTIKPISKFYSIARTNRRIFNLCSEIDEVIRNQAFNILTYPVGPTQTAKEVQEIVVGTENVLGYDGTLGGKPSYTSPDAQPLEQMRKERADLVQEIYRMATLSFVTGVKEEKSGSAKEWDYNNTNQAISDFANNCKNLEIDMVNIFEAWTNESVEYACTYSKDFGIIDVVAKLQEITSAMDLQIGGEFDVGLAKQATQVMFRDSVQAAIQIVIDDINTRYKSEVDNRVKNNPPVGGEEDDE